MKECDYTIAERILVHVLGYCLQRDLRSRRWGIHPFQQAAAALLYQFVRFRFSKLVISLKGVSLTLYKYCLRVKLHFIDILIESLVNNSCAFVFCVAKKRTQ